MGRYDDAAREAADETDIELAAGLKKLEKCDIDNLVKDISNGYDQCQVGKLIARLKKSTTANYRAGVYKAFLRKASASAGKAVKKYIGV